MQILQLNVKHEKNPLLWRGFWYYEPKITAKSSKLWKRS